MSESVKQSGNGGGKKGSKGKSKNAGKDQGKGKKQGGKGPAKPVAGKRGSNVASLEAEVEKELRKAQGGSSEATDEATEADPDDENFDEPDEEVYDGMGSVFFPVDQVYALILAVTSNAGLKNQSYMSYRRLFDNTPIATFAIGMRIFSDPPDTELEAIIRDFQHGLLHGREIVYTTNVIAKTLTNGIKGRITLEVTEAQKQGIRVIFGTNPERSKTPVGYIFLLLLGSLLDSFTIDEALAKAKQLITASSATLTLADIMNKDGLNVCAITAYLTDDNPPEWVPVVKILRVIGETPETISALNESEAFEFISTVITARRTMISRTNALLGQHHSTKDVGLERVKTGLGQLVGAQQQPKSYYGDYESTEHVHEEGDY